MYIGDYQCWSNVLQIFAYKKIHRVIFSKCCRISKENKEIRPMFYISAGYVVCYQHPVLSQMLSFPKKLYLLPTCVLSDCFCKKYVTGLSNRVYRKKCLILIEEDPELWVKFIYMKTFSKYSYTILLWTILVHGWISFLKNSQDTANNN